MALDANVLQVEHGHVLCDDALAHHGLNTASHSRDKGLGICREGHVDILERQARYLALGQARDVGRGGMAVDSLDIAKRHGAKAGRAVVNGQRLAVLDIIGLAVLVAEVERVDHEGREHLVHANVLKGDALVDGVLAATATGLNTQAAISALEQALAHGKVLDAAGGLGTQNHGTVAIVHVAVRDQHVVRCGAKLGLNAQLAALDGDTVVAHRELAAQDANKAAALGIEAVSVVGVLGALDGQAERIDVLAQNGVDVPRRAVADGKAGQAHVRALGQEDHARAGDLATLLGAEDILKVLVPPVVLGKIGLAVNCTAAIDAHVAHAQAGKGRAIGREALALPTAQRRHVGTGITGAFLALHRARDVGKRRAVVAGQQHGALGKLDVDMALEEERLDAVVTGGNQYAATLGAGHDGGLDVGGVVVLGIALGAAIANVDGKGLGRRGDADAQLALAADKANQVALAGNQAVDIGLDLIRGAGGLVVNKDLPRIGAGKVTAIVELDNGRAGVAPDNVRIHGSLPIKVL